MAQMGNEYCLGRGKIVDGIMERKKERFPGKIDWEVVGESVRRNLGRKWGLH